jgi:hypothetical protein
MTLPAAALWSQHDRLEPDGTRFVWVRHDPSVAALPARNVIVGPGGWNFPCDDAVASIEQMLGRLVPTGPALRDYRLALEERARRLSDMGILYLVVIVPSKATVHPERLPASSPPLGAMSAGRELLVALSDGEVQAIDLAPALRERARAGEQLYHLRDQHWNHAGALAASEVILQALRAAGLSVDVLGPDAITWVAERFDGDLAARPGVALEGGRLRPVASVEAPEVTRRPDEAAIGLLRTPAAPGVTEVDCLARFGAPRALIDHDPSGEWMIPFLGAAFSHSVWRARGPLDAALIEREQPDVVLELIEEWELVRGPYSAPASVGSS